MNIKLQALKGIGLLILICVMLLGCASAKKAKTSAQATGYQEHYQIVKGGAKLSALGLSTGSTINLDDIGIEATVTKLADSSYLIRERRLVINKTTGRSVPLISIVKNKRSDLSSYKNDNSIIAGKKADLSQGKIEKNADLSQGKIEAKKIIVKDKSKEGSGNKIKFQFPWWILIVIAVLFLLYRYRKFFFRV
ncbi:MAG: hypothetical protein M3421_06345 [Bacteroidota bacterium]|nr:hypothetical protein [Bacteroidota bacterium]